MKLLSVPSLSSIARNLSSLVDKLKMKSKPKENEVKKVYYKDVNFDVYKKIF